MDIEKEQLKLRLIEAQMQVLQYQHKEVTEALKTAQQALHDAAADARND